MSQCFERKSILNCNHSQLLNQNTPLILCSEFIAFRISFKNLELNVEHTANKSPFIILVLGDFNARMHCWYQNDVTAFEECKTDIATSQFSLSQVMKEPTHI